MELWALFDRFVWRGLNIDDDPSFLRFEDQSHTEGVRTQLGRTRFSGLCRTQDHKIFEEFRNDRFSLTTCMMISVESQLYQKYCSLLVSMFAFIMTWVSCTIRPPQLPGWWCHGMKLVVRKSRTPNLMMTSLPHHEMQLVKVDSLHVSQGIPFGLLIQSTTVSINRPPFTVMVKPAHPCRLFCIASSSLVLHCLQFSFHFGT